MPLKFIYFSVKNFNYLLIIIGVGVAMYSKVGTQQSQYILIAGITILMFGIYRISKNIPGKHKKEESRDNEKR